MVISHRGRPVGFDKKLSLRADAVKLSKLLGGKKVIFIVVGGGSIKNSKAVINQALKNFASAHKMKIINSYAFQALKNDELKNSKKAEKAVKKIIDDIKSLKK